MAARQLHRRQSWWRRIQFLISIIVVGILFILNIWRSLHFRGSLQSNSVDDSILPPQREIEDLRLEPLADIKNHVNNHGEEKWDSSKSVVIGMINGYHLGIYQTFVGSLRATGYPGYIILGIASNAPQGTIDYLTSQNVTIKYIENADKCTFNGTKLNTGEVVDMQKTGGWKCSKDHPDYKITWGRFVHYRDWLEECPQCIDGVILTDVRDAYFQRDPFVTAVERNQQNALMVFEEDPELDNTNWLTVLPVSSCRKYSVGKTRMLCSGSTMGSREGILTYLNVMKEEFDYWKIREECRLNMKGDDQSIHNYLYYTGRLNHAVSIPYREGPINVVGYRAARISEQAQKEAKEKGLDRVEGDFYIRNGKWQEWLPPEHGMIDPETGLLVNLDGTPSAQVHQVDRFGEMNSHWILQMKKTGWIYNKGDVRQTTGKEPQPAKAKSNDDGYIFLRPSDFKPMGFKTSVLYADAEESARALLKEAQTPRSVPDDAIDPVVEEARCNRYNLMYSGRKERRRIFYGSNIADDSWNIISAHALEFYGIFHTVVFSESNRTQMHYPRDFRFGEDSESLAVLKNGIYGPNTQVRVEQYINEIGWPKGLGYEGLQSGPIIEYWKSKGMQHGDIGYLSDVDEIYSRDYLRAMQICDVAQFDAHENCRDARISASSLVFEGGPLCRTARTWSHPDLTAGECIEGISNTPSLHPHPERGWKGTGWQGDGYTKNTGFYKLPKNATHFPLHNAHDFRRISGRVYGGVGFQYNAFHLHNFFPNANILRNKYKTYGHPVKGAMEMSLGDIHEDVRVMIGCAFNTNTTSDSEKEYQYKLVKEGLNSLKGPKPLAFQVPGYVEARMTELKQMLHRDGHSDGSK